jgi:hypothetical protein
LAARARCLHALLALLTPNPRGEATARVTGAHPMWCAIARES